METAQVLRMKGGSDAESYARNSTPQAANMSKSLPVMQRALIDFCAWNSPRAVAVADLGCSSGPNALAAVSEIVTTIQKSYRKLGRPSPEFSVFLNDLPSNDFNTMFKSVPEFLKKLQDQNGQDFEPPCYVAGVPGTFYGRLFPAKSLHFVHSSSSLHWLSQVPLELARSESGNPLINRGKIYISETSPPEVLDAYKNQFQRDFFFFLKSRSEEIVPRGRMILTFKGRRTSDPTHDESCLLWDYMGMSLQGLVDEGLVKEETLDAYNVPYYDPYIEDVREEIKREGSFLIHRLDTVSIPWVGISGGRQCSRAETSENMAKVLRAINESMLQSHFGDQVVDQLFRRFTEIMAADTKEVEFISIVASLIRKS